MGLRTLIRKIKAKKTAKVKNEGKHEDRRFRRDTITRIDTNQDYQTHPSPPPSASASTKKGTDSFSVCALYDFNSEQPDECSFIIGDILTVLDDSKEWWEAKNIRTQSVGLIPQNYVTRDIAVAGVLEAWYDVDRLEAERLLLLPGVEAGTYLLRPRGGRFCLLAFRIMFK